MLSEEERRLQLTGNNGELLSNSPRIHPTALQEENQLQLKSYDMAPKIKMNANVKKYVCERCITIRFEIINQKETLMAQVMPSRT